jgi:hypothetical protein
MGGWKTAWKAERKLDHAILKGDPDDASAKPLAGRSHHLRDTAILRGVNAGIPIRLELRCSKLFRIWLLR